MDIEDYELERAIEKKNLIDENNKIIRTAKAQWLSNFKDGKIKLTTVKDLKDLIEIEMHLKNMK
ncbi:hypothetical protein BG261_05425 [Floricoccus tropicus]|uniref:Uncharacterized protein n=1 Tax=Floricoccus tropicus TaxID=1859473 RepID=A0A1E8GKQ6_9LACT|nr:hypothetical protein [Floricoccus tropicus]OFI48830.1 hypothetical protein BG261_05425 [Floricoccus tropicus]